MNYIPITIIAFVLNGAALLVDKFLITKKIPDPLIYIFYFSLFSLVLLFFIPFAKFPTPFSFLLASFSTISWTFGVYFMLKALQTSQASRVIPIIGALVPVFLLIEALFSNRLLNRETLGAGVLIVGMLFIILPEILGGKQERKKIFSYELPLATTSAFLFATSYLILSFAYEISNFFTVFVYSRLILIPLGIFLIFLPKTRQIIFPSGNPSINYPGGFNIFSKTGALFLCGQATAGIAQIILLFSISLATPALVNSLQGFTYIFIFLTSIILSKKYPDIFREKVGFLNISLKSSGIILIFAGLYILAFLEKI